MIDNKTRAAVIERDSSTCQDCGHVGKTGSRKGDIQAHHIVPERLGGADGKDNLIALCVECHSNADTQLRRVCPSKDSHGRNIPYQSAMSQVVQVPMTDKMKLDMQKIINGLDYPLTLPAAMRKAAQEWIDNRRQEAA